MIEISQPFLLRIINTKDYLHIIRRVDGFLPFYHKVGDNNDKQNIDHKRYDKQNNKCYTGSVVTVIIIVTCWLHILRHFV